MAERQDYYAVKVRCRNCGFIGRVRIARGTPSNYKACPRCNVARLDVASAYRWERLSWMFGGHGG